MQGKMAQALTSICTVAGRYTGCDSYSDALGDAVQVCETLGGFRQRTFGHLSSVGVFAHSLVMVILILGRLASVVEMAAWLALAC